MRHRGTSLRWIVAATAVAVLVWSVSAPALALTDGERAGRGVGFIASKQRTNGSIPAFSAIGSTADAVLAMVAAGYGRSNVRDAMKYLDRQVRRVNVTTVGLEGKVAMAAVAAGKDPTDFGGVDLIQSISSTEQPDGRLGSDTPVLEDALGVLALEAAGRTVSARALSWLASAQCPDGGWQYDEPYDPATDSKHCLDKSSPGTDYYESDTNTSGLVVQALDGPAGNPPPATGSDPFGFFDAIRDPGFGGWGYTWGYRTTDANSTALVIQAYAAAGKRLPSGAMAALRALQYRRCGAWAFTWDGSAGSATRTSPDLGATIGAVPGVLRAQMPIFPHGALAPAPDTPPCPS
ncbi:MAG: hypothetical protein HY240_02495 [Actinobacteria bacterium]|nr:hypothetical protein [Actinomycetota bacterium]